MLVCKYLIYGHLIAAERGGSLKFICGNSDHIVLEKCFCLPYFSRFYVYYLIYVQIMRLHQFSLI